MSLRRHPTGDAHEAQGLLASRRFTALALATFALLAAACSGDAQPVFLEETVIGGLGSGLGADYDRVMSDYLEGDATAEELAEVMEVPDPVVVSPEDFPGYGISYTGNAEQLREEARALELAGYDNGQDKHKISVSQLARYFSNAHLSTLICGNGGCFEDALPPVWWMHAWLEPDSYHDYVSDLHNHVRDHFYYDSKFYPLLQLYLLGFSDLYCFETLGMDVEGLTGLVFLDVVNGFNLLNPGVYGHDEVVRRVETLELTEEELPEAYSRCDSGDAWWAFPIPFDLAQAHRILQDDLRDVIQRWIEVNKDKQPSTLTITN